MCKELEAGDCIARVLVFLIGLSFAFILLCTVLGLTLELCLKLCKYCCVETVRTPYPRYTPDSQLSTIHIPNPELPPSYSSLELNKIPESNAVN